ncbi:hypothetical protein GF377_04765 [candidate division GN15 bacterium]|nr:hypothetical protein [candidate division GN15 bacterium]
MTANGTTGYRTGLTVATVLLLLVAGPGLLQADPAQTVAPLSVGVGDTLSFDPDGRVIDSIIIDNRNIYDTDDPRYDAFLFKLANNLHIVTREKVIRRELLFETGDRYDQEIALETARNLRVRFPFNDAWIDVVEASDSSVVVRVVTIDQWSLIGGVRSVDTDGNETNIRVGFEERNLLGRAQFLSFDFDYQEEDENFITTVFRDNRLFGYPMRFALGYSDNPKGEVRELIFGRPFYSLEQRFSFLLGLARTGGRVERFFDGDQVAQWQADADQVDLEVRYRWGPYHRKLGLVGEYDYVYKRVSDRRILDTAGFARTGFPNDSLYHQFNVGMEYTFRRFLVVKRINGFEYNEDFNAGVEFSATTGRAFNTSFDDYLYDFIELEASATDRLAGHIVSAEYNRSFWFRREDDFRRLTEFRLWIYNNQLDFMTVAFKTAYVSDKSDDPNPLALGGKSGLRGYDTEFRSGDRAHVINLEARLYPGFELLSVKLGAAVFADLGRTFTTGEKFTLDDYYASVGAGLRLSFEKFTRAELARIDVAVTRDGNVQVSLGTGQYF